MEAKTLDRMQADIKAVTDSGEFEAILSMPTLDRDGEIIDVRAFEPLPEYIPIDIDHGMSVSSVVGSGQPFYDGDMLKLRGQFASTELGQEVRTLVVEGHVRKMSVAFMAAQRSEDADGVPHIVKAELLNAAIVAIPSNREADILAAKAQDQKASKGQTLQQIHDLAAAAGAECAAKHADEADSKIPTPTDPEETPAPVAAVPPADVAVARARALVAEAQLAL